MTEREHTRLIAWAHEIRAVHGRLREALDLVQQMSAGDGADPQVTSDLLVFCRGFCTARKHDQNAIEVLRQLFTDTAWIPAAGAAP